MVRARDWRLLDSFSGFLMEAILLVGLLVFTPQTLHFDLDAPASPSGAPSWPHRRPGRAPAMVSMLAPEPRRQFLTGRGVWWPTVRGALHGLRSPRRLLLLFGGNLVSILLFSATLGLFVVALGTSCPSADLVVTTISVSLLAGLLPVPGGIGVVESGLTFGLVAAGMPEAPAFAAE